MSKVFSPYPLNARLTLKNRLAVAPMTTTQSNPDGTISLVEAEWLERLAADGYGMVISCAAAISQESIAFDNQLNFGNKQALHHFGYIAQRMKRNGSANIIQLCHAGSRAIQSTPFSASSYAMPQIPGFVPPQELTKEHIKQIVTDFADACALIESLGFDGVEFHGANGYLFTQFFSTMTNLRTDEYGQSMENRARFAIEVVRACRKVVSPDFVLGFRMSFESAGLETGLDMDDSIQIVNLLIEEGISYVHISSLDYRANSVKYPDRNAMQYIKSKMIPTVPLIGVGGVFSMTDAVQAMEYGADIVAIGRAAIGNKDLPKIFERGEEVSNRNPFPESSLQELRIDRNFIGYLRKMPVANLNVVQ